MLKGLLSYYIYYKFKYFDYLSRYVIYYVVVKCVRVYDGINLNKFIKYVILWVRSESRFILSKCILLFDFFFLIGCIVRGLFGLVDCI